LLPHLFLFHNQTKIGGSSGYSADLVENLLTLSNPKHDYLHQAVPAAAITATTHLSLYLMTSCYCKPLLKLLLCSVM
jgi:hypothetical protein